MNSGNQSFVQAIAANELPEHNNVITGKDDAEKVQICSNLFCINYINKWVPQFCGETNTEWNFRSSKPNGCKIVCKLVATSLYYSINSIAAFLSIFEFLLVKFLLINIISVPVRKICVC